MTPDQKKQKRPARRLPKEGDDGCFSQTWYPICLTSELGDGHVLGQDFLGGRVIVFRDNNGQASVLSAFCAHLGVDMSVGDVVDGAIRCPYHHFQYDSAGTCIKTGVGAPPPKGATLFKFPTIERYGVILAFNGIEPLFDLPQLSVPDDQVVTQCWVDEMDFKVDPWVVMAQTPDFDHIAFLHDGRFQDAGRPEFTYTDHSALYESEGVSMGERGDFMDLKSNLYGTNILNLEMTIQGTWTGSIAALTIRKPGHVKLYGINGLRKGDGSPESDEKIKQTFAYIKEQNRIVLYEDAEVFNNIRFVQGTLLPSDKELAQYFDYLRAFPRANPAADFINGTGDD